MQTQVCPVFMDTGLKLPQSNNLCPFWQRGEEGHFHKFPAFRQTEGEQSLFFAAASHCLQFTITLRPKCRVLGMVYSAAVQ